MSALHIVFDGMPGPDGPRFVEVETPDGKSINAGEWRKRADGLCELVIGASRPLGDREEIARIIDPFGFEIGNPARQVSAYYRADAILSLLSGSEAAGDGWRPPKGWSILPDEADLDMVTVFWELVDWKAIGRADVDHVKALWSAMADAAPAPPRTPLAAAPTPSGQEQGGEA